MCGVTITCGSEARGWLGGGGSWLKTSSAAPATLPARIASASARSWITSPRAQLMRRTPGFIRARAAASIMPAVSGVSETWRLM